MMRFERRVVGLVTLLILATTALGVGAQAQTPIVLAASPVSTEDFPTVGLSFTVTDAQGQRISGLTAEGFSVAEDGSPIPDPIVRETEVGSRQVFAILTGRALQIRDSQGRTRFDFVRQALLDWWTGPDVGPYGSDDLTLVTSDGPLAIHASASTLGLALTTHQPTFAQGGSDYDLLTLALGYLADPPPNDDMPGSLILFAPPLEGLTDVLSESVVARARQTATAIYPVLVGPPEAVDTPGAESLRRLASQTGGVFSVFDPGDGLEDLTQKVTGRRFVYTVRYSSQANTSGIHQTTVQVEVPQSGAATLEQNFAVEILPPELSFIQPPSQIVRQADDPSLTIDLLPPTTQDLRILVDFPDGHPRPIESASLFVDDQPAGRIDAPPFDHFTLDLTRFVETGSHTLRVEAQDSLGLSSASDPVQLQVEVRPPPRGLAALRPALGSIAAALAVLVIGVAVAVSLMSAGRRQPAAGRRHGRAARLPPTKRRASMHNGPGETSIEAVLVPVDSRGQEGKALPLTGVDVVLGRDASLAGIVLEDPSVSGMHARMIRLAGGGYLLRDQDSVAGTWINFQPVLNDGTQLAHEDLIHLGRVALRFRLASPPPAREIRVRPLDDPAELEATAS